LDWSHFKPNNYGSTWVFSLPVVQCMIVFI